MHDEDHCGQAARLLYKGLQPKLHPQQDNEYRDLVRAWHGDAALRASLERVAAAMELQVVDLTDQGLVLAPAVNNAKLWPATPACAA